MAGECDETAANLYCVYHSLTGSETPMEARCHEITKLLEEWRDGDESALEELMGMSFKRTHSHATGHTPQLDRMVKTAAG